jgi:hypothetical protein
VGPVGPEVVANCVTDPSAPVINNLPAEIVPPVMLTPDIVPATSNSFEGIALLLLPI